MNCYRQENLFFPHGILDNIIDMVYILTMESSKSRHIHIQNQLSKFPLCQHIKIIYNKGFTKCSKKICSMTTCKLIQTSYQDITHVNEYIYQDILKNKYNNILVLEDDFIISPQITNKDVISDLEDIVKYYKEEKLLLRLGCLPIVSYNMTGSSQYGNLVLGLGAHALLYNRNSVNEIVRKVRKSEDFDVNLNISFIGNQLYYKKKSLISQLFPVTENRRNWGKSYGYVIEKYFQFLMFRCISLLKLDKTVEPGYTVMYKYHNYLFSILFIFHVYLLFIIIKKIF